MKTQKRLLLGLITVFLVTLLMQNSVFAVDLNQYLRATEYSKEYLEWLELTDEEKEKSLFPRMYNIPSYMTRTASNPLKMARAAGRTAVSKYNLKNYIPENIVVKNPGNSWFLLGIRWTSIIRD